MNRSEEIIKHLTDCCLSSAILYDKRFPSIKFFPDEGKLMFIENSRMLDPVEFQIPSWNPDIDIPLIFQTLKSDPCWRYWESHKVNGQYCYSIIFDQLIRDH